MIQNVSVCLCIFVCLCAYFSDSSTKTYNTVRSNTVYHDACFLFRLWVEGQWIKALYFVFKQSSINGLAPYDGNSLNFFFQF